MNHSEIKIAPSILSANFACLAEELSLLHQADWIHVDVMDGHFVPNLTMGPMVVQAIRPLTKQVIDVHLMIAQPDRYLHAFAESGADVITVHQEATVHLQRTLSAIRKLGKKAGVALNPATPLDTLAYVLDDIDLLLIMTVNPGFGGQVFLPAMLRKIAAARKWLDEQQCQHILIEVDGGIIPETAYQVIKAGADVLVAGSYIFSQTDRDAAIERLRNNE